MYKDVKAQIAVLAKKNFMLACHRTFYQILSFSLDSMQQNKSKYANKQNPWNWNPSMKKTITVSETG